MASDLISREKAKEEILAWARVITNPKILSTEDTMTVLDMLAPVDAIPIDDVAEMLADLFGDECACNYNHIDQTLAMGCERDSCPDDGDYSCWKKYVEHWIKRKTDGGATHD